MKINKIVFFIPIVGLLVAYVRHGKACKLHRKACREYWAQEDVWNDKATWRAFNLVFAEGENVFVATISSIIGILILCAIGWLSR